MALKQQKVGLCNIIIVRADKIIMQYLNTND